MTTASQKTRVTRNVPPMASRHFWFIADTIMQVREEGNAGSIACDELAKTFARRLRASNGMFRTEQFLEACGVNQ
jgi:hypothetical protein